MVKILTSPVQGDVPFGGHKATGLADPSAAQDAATKAYVDAVAQGLSVKASVRAASTANIASQSGLLTVDGVTLVDGDRVLAKDQTTGSTNGIWVAHSGAWTRATDADTGAELVGAFVFVEEGATNAGSGWVQTAAAPITVGTTSLTWVQFSGAGQIVAGAGLAKSGNTLRRAASATGYANLAALPSAAANNGLLERTADGGIYESDGSAWQIVRDPSGTSAPDLSASPLGPLGGNTLIGWYSADTVKGNDGAAVAVWKDQSGQGNDLIQFTAANQPILKKSIINGLPVVRFSATQWIKNAGFTQAQPVSVFCVMRADANLGANRNIVSGTTTTNLFIDSTRGCLSINAGNNTVGGPRIDDGAAHVVSARFDNTVGKGYVDGAAVQGSTNIGANTLAAFTVGASGSGSSPLTGDVAEVIVVAGKMTRVQHFKVCTYLAKKYGVTLAPGAQESNADGLFFDTTSANGQSIRVWQPADFNPSVGAPLVIYNHVAGGSQQVSLANFSGGWVLVESLVDQGWLVAASNMHGDSWGNTNAVGDVVDLYNFMAARYTVTSVIFLGHSMGAMAAALAIPDGRIPNIKGVFTIDGVLNLLSMYANATYTTSIDTAYGITRGTLSGSTIVGATSLPTTSSFPTIGTQLLVGNGTANVETVTTTGASNGTSVAVTAFTKTHASADQVSDYPTKTATHDPVLRPASDFGTVAFRFYASSADTTVPKTTNADQFAALIAATAAESTVVPLLQTHIDGSHNLPSDFVAFIKRRAV